MLKSLDSTLKMTGNRLMTSLVHKSYVIHFRKFTPEDHVAKGGDRLGRLVKHNGSQGRRERVRVRIRGAPGMAKTCTGYLEILGLDDMGHKREKMNIDTIPRAQLGRRRRSRRWRRRVEEQRS